MESKSKLNKCISLIGLILLVTSYVNAQDSTLSFHGAAWLQMGRVEKSYTTPKHEGNDYNKNWMQNAGGLLSSDIKVDDNWAGNFGLGILQVHLARGNRYHSNILYPFWVPFVSEAKVSYSSPLFTEKDKFKLTLGSIPYNYNPDVKSLGLYLLRGYVYPGAIVSGFGNIFGGIASYEFSNVSNDLIANFESDDQPWYDLSIADVVNFRITPGLELGAGVNFYRAIPQNPSLTAPGKDCDFRNDLGFYAKKCYEVDSVGVDQTGGTVYDTVTGTLAGTKIMARVHLDPKLLFGFAGAFGKNDLTLYGEAAILGVKNQGKSYDNILQRIPVMVGFNFPMFNYLDNLTLEIEYYASKNSSDNIEAIYGSWVPVKDPETNTNRDDWKWSINGSKTILGNINWSLQVANDHLRIGGYHDSQTGVEVTTTPKDWYWTTKMAYFF